MDEIENVLAALGPSCRQRPAAVPACWACIWKARTSTPASWAHKPDDACQAVLSQIEKLTQLAPIALLTLAPEIPGHMDIIRALSDAGIRVQIGHTWAVMKMACRPCSKVPPALPICSMP
jgi:N-acetylglucosamine-6-phosphate deacetylase